MRILSLADIGAAGWDAVADASPYGWLFHRARWIGIESRFFVRRDLSFALEREGRVVGIHPLYLSDPSSVGAGAIPERLLHSGIHRHAGLALVDGARLREAQAAAMAHIHRLAEELDVDRIHLSTQNLAPANLCERRREIPYWVDDYGYYLGLNFTSQCMSPGPGLATCCADQIVDLAAPEDDLFAALDESCRRAVRKAEREGCEAVPGEGAESLEDYYALAVLSARRTGEALPAIDYYEAVHDAFAREGRCRILFVRASGRLVAGLILLIDKGAASFLAGVSDPEALPLRVNDFVHWAAIRWAKANGLRRYRLGPYFPEVPRDWPIASRSYFKTKFGGRSTTMIQGSRFRRPEIYQAAAVAHIAALCGRSATARQAEAEAV